MKWFDFFNYQALSREDWFLKWGRHYLQSLQRSHALQQCNNFKVWWLCFLVSNWYVIIDSNCLNSYYYYAFLYGFRYEVGNSAVNQLIIKWNQFVCLSVRPSVRLPFCLSVCLSVCLLVCLSLCLPVSLFACLLVCVCLTASFPPESCHQSLSLCLHSRYWRVCELHWFELELLVIGSVIMILS